MTQVEYIEQLAALEQEGREIRRAHEVQLQLIETKHRENVNLENDRYNNEKRKQKAEYITKADDLHQRTTELKKARAIARAEEEKALMQNQ
jgi:hypothetical protein